MLSRLLSGGIELKEFFMMKRGLFFLLVFAVVSTGGVFAQTWYDSYSPAVAEAKVLVNAGIGLGFSSYGFGLPPITVSADFKLPIELPITVGGTVGLGTWGGFDFMNIAFGGRGMYHFNFAAISDSDFLKKLDVYSGLTLGHVIQITSIEGLIGKSFFLFGFCVAARYFFNEKMGVYLESGYSGLQALSLGLTMKF